MVTHFKKSLLPAALLSASVGASMPTDTLAQGQLALEEVIVTARKKEESLIDVPISITSVSGEDIFNLNITDIENLQDSLPNLSIVSTALSAQRTYVRGQGSDTNQGFEQSVGWFVDGIYGGRGEQFKSPLFDVASVELLRGPQGTVLGKNIIAGAINIRTARPTDEFEGRVSALYTDETEEQKYEAVISGALSDNVRGRLGLMSRTTEGWIENTASAAPDFGDDLGAQDDSVARLSLEWDVTENLYAFFKAETASADVDGISNQIVLNAASASRAGVIASEDDVRLSDTSTVLTPCGVQESRNGRLAGSCAARGESGTFQEISSDNYVLQFDYDLQGYTISALSGWSEFDSERLIDSDYSNLTLLDNWQVQSFEQFSQELRITSPGGSSFDWTAGFYYQDNEYVTDNGNIIDLAPGARPSFDLDRHFEQDSKTQSVFAEGTLNLSDNLRFILGWRWTDEDKSFDKRYGLINPESGQPLIATNGAADAGAIGFASAALGGAWAQESESNVVDNVIYYSGERQEDEHTFAGTLQYDWGNSQLYANIAEGFKAGGFDEGGRALENRQFEEENALAFEVGGKFLLADGAANVNVAIFRVEYDDLQVSVFTGLGFVVGNAAKSTSQGVEIDGKWQITEKFRLGGAAAYLNSEYDEYDTAPCTVLQRAVTSPCTQDLAGASTNFAPRYSGNINAEYVTPVFDNLEFTARVDVSYRDEMYTQGDNDPLDKLSSYTKVDARLSLGSVDSGWRVSVIGKNLSDKRYALFSGDTPLVSGSHGQPAALPRTISLQATYSF